MVFLTERYEDPALTNNDRTVIIAHGKKWVVIRMSKKNLRRANQLPLHDW